eukprot:TRINITY_DN18403_c0_g4_i1.p1 TRINITY_DN18403_c0_g4~~TRINITY_DN18403_c0_g4_i1.p1  ORF type:complete len:314 (+),score=89.46 TRINITY_DN18403_c0_g4_i1:95-1036(+)
MAAAAAAQSPIAARLASVKHVVIVLSGKGGVGKSTVACQLALALSAEGRRVGVLDVDLCGPSVPKILGVEGQDVRQGEAGWIPVEAAGGRVCVMSIQFLLQSEADAVVWRGPRKDACIKQFLGDVSWGALDCLVVDTPPGTSDEHITLCECLKGVPNVGAIVVTAPQQVSTDDVAKELSFCKKLGLAVHGVVENMSGFVCPHCAGCTPIFSSGGGAELARRYDVPFIGAVPIDPRLAACEDRGESFVESFPESGAAQALQRVVAALHAHLGPPQGAPAAPAPPAAAQQPPRGGYASAPAAGSGGGDAMQTDGP